MITAIFTTEKQTTFAPLADHTALALCLSLLIHLAVIFSFLHLGPNSNVVSTRLPIPIDVTHLSQSQLNRMILASIPADNIKNQIVSRPENESKTSPQSTRLLSEINTSTAHEQIHRGLPTAKDNSLQQTAKASPKTTKLTPLSSGEKKEQKNADSSSKKTPQLFLDTEGTLALSSTKQPPKMTPNQSSTSIPELGSERLAQINPFASNSQSLNGDGIRFGSTDFLPDLPDGDITLLNTKADQFAIFVRRVAQQVFGTMRHLNWQQISRAEISRLTAFVSIEAILDKNGNLKKVIFHGSSGSALFDRMVKEAVSTSAQDSNPPSQAMASDGYIHFIFKARSWSRVGQNGLSERRWILLGTGLL